jgi:lincosamide nucleotidyltransferase
LAGRVLFQEELIGRVRVACAADPGLDAALMYGSFAADEADGHSDIEFWLFFTPERRAEIDPRAWCGRIEPVRHVLVNEFGTHVAFFPGLVRGEFHFATVGDVDAVREWPARGAAVERMIVLDRSGRLTPALQSVPEWAPLPADGPQIIAEYCDPMINWLVLAHHLVARGEQLRAWDALGHAQRYLLWTARLAENSTAHWLTPSRAAETELSPATVASLRAATAAAGPQSLTEALIAASGLGERLWRTLAGRYGLTVPDELLAELRAALAGSR